MRWFACLVVSCFSIIGVAAADELTAERDRFLCGFVPQQIAPSVYVIHGPSGLPDRENFGFMNNPGFVITDEGVVVIDPGSSRAAGEMVRQRIEETTDLPVIALFNTHVHGDHWLGNQAFAEQNPDLPIYGSAKFIEMVDAGAGEQWTSLIDKMTAGAAGSTEPFGPTHPVADGDDVVLGGMHFQILRNEKAHTETDIVVVVDEPGVVFLGDNTFNGRIGRLDDGSPGGITRILDRVLERDLKHFVPGHGQSGGPEVAQDYRNLIAAIYDNVEALYGEGLADFEMKPIIVERMAPEFGDLDGFAEDIGRAISIAYLEVEEAAF